MGLGISNCVKKVKDGIGKAVSKGVDTVKSVAGAAVNGVQSGNISNEMIQNTTSGVNKISKCELKASLKDMINKETDPKKKAELEALYAKLDEEDKLKAASSGCCGASKSNCSGGSQPVSSCGNAAKSSGCCGANSAANSQVDKQSAMKNLYIAEKNLEAASGTQSNVSNPFSSEESGSSNQEQAQQAYEQAKAVAQQAGVSDEEYAAFKQQKQQEEEQNKVQV